MIKRKPLFNKWYPNIIDVIQVLDSTTQAGLPDGRYVPARPLGYQAWWVRWKAAWMVFKGEADALTWPGQ